MIFRPARRWGGAQREDLRPATGRTHAISTWRNTTNPSPDRPERTNRIKLCCVNTVAEWMLVKALLSQCWSMGPALLVRSVYMTLWEEVWVGDYADGDLYGHTTTHCGFVPVNSSSPWLQHKRSFRKNIFYALRWEIIVLLFLVLGTLKYNKMKHFCSIMFQGLRSPHQEEETVIWETHDLEKSSLKKK